MPGLDGGRDHGTIPDALERAAAAAQGYGRPNL